MPNTELRLGVDPDFSLMPGLFSRPVRPHVRALGRFVRLADAITDDPTASREQKIARLQALQRVLDGSDEVLWSERTTGVALAFRDSLRATGLPDGYARSVLQAFHRDASGDAAATWPALLEYCRAAAAPIGRHLLHLVGEDLPKCTPTADALCAGLRILKQLRDCRDPAVQYNRLCIPRQFLDDAMISPAHLRAPAARGQTRAVLDRVLDGVERLLADASPLPDLIRNRGLSTHTAIVLCRAGKLTRRFRLRDPLQERVGLGEAQRLACQWLGMVRGLRRRGRTG